MLTTTIYANNSRDFNNERIASRQRLPLQKIRFRLWANFPTLHEKWGYYFWEDTRIGVKVKFYFHKKNITVKALGNWNAIKDKVDGILIDFHCIPYCDSHDAIYELPAEEEQLFEKDSHYNYSIYFYICMLVLFFLFVLYLRIAHGVYWFPRW